MGTTERKQREREEREQLFLAKARELITTDGLIHLQMARLAEACDYATGTLYQHFSSKEDLLVALADQGGQRYVDVFRRVMQWDACSRDRMFALAVADTHFAEVHPEHARLVQYVSCEVVWENASLQRRRSMLEGCAPIQQIVCSIVQDALDRGDLQSQGLRNSELALGPWSLCEGMHRLVHTQGLLEAFQIDKTNELLYRQVHVHLNGMGWQPLMDLADPEAIDRLVQRIHAEVLSES